MVDSYGIKDRIAEGEMIVDSERTEMAVVNTCFWKKGEQLEEALWGRDEQQEYWEYCQARREAK